MVDFFMSTSEDLGPGSKAHPFRSRLSQPSTPIHQSAHPHTRQGMIFQKCCSFRLGLAVIILFLDIKPMTVFIKSDQSADPWVFPDSKLSLMGSGLSSFGVSQRRHSGFSTTSRKSTIPVLVIHLYITS